MNEQTKSQELFNQAKKAGKISKNVPFLELAKKMFDENGKLKGVRGTGPHRVKLLKDRIIMGKDFRTGVERKEMEYTFEENGEEKIYRRPIFGEDGNLHYFIEGMKDFDYGDKLILEYKRRGDKGYIQISKVEVQETKETPFVKDDEIPVIEEGTYPDTETSNESGEDSDF